jgi:nucleoside-diphosphate-sugar epimerase
VAMNRFVPPDTITELEAALSRPTLGVLATLRQLDGDIMILGAGGKMGPTLARMARRGCDEIGQPKRRVIAVSRFSSADAARSLHEHGIETLSCDLLSLAAVNALPDVPNIIFMAGQKFGTSDAPGLTWALNTVVPAIVAERFRTARIVVFSTGCVYPLMPVSGRGAAEDDPLTPPGEYANSCVGRERVFEYFAAAHGTRLLMFRLCYAIDLRYGVLVDVARQVAAGQPVDVSMGFAHVIWQGDANARAIQCLAHAACPPAALNVTGLERVSIRELARRFGERLGREAIITGSEAATAWIWDAHRSYEMLGPPEVSLDEMVEATAHWLLGGGRTLGKPTRFEVQDGRF